MKFWFGDVFGEFSHFVMQVGCFCLAFVALLWVNASPKLIQLELLQVFIELVHRDLFRLCEVPLFRADIWTETTTKLVLSICLELIIISVMK